MSPRNSVKTRRDCFDRHKYTDPVSERIMLTCHICGLPIDPAREQWEAEHVIRRILRPSDDPKDVLPAHKKGCHEAKTAKDITENAKGKRVRDLHYNIKQRGSSFGWSRKWKKKINGTVERRD